MAPSRRDLGWGWAAETGIWGVFVEHVSAVSREEISTASSDTEGTEEGMKTDGEKRKMTWIKKKRRKKDFPHSIDAVFPWQPFSQRGRRQERLWCPVRIF